MRRTLSTGLCAGLLVCGAGAASAKTPRWNLGRNSRPGCSKTYTVAMFRRAARATYSGTRDPSKSDLRHLRRYERCVRHPWGGKVDRGIWRWQRKHNAARKVAATHTAIASWYYDGGSTASGFHAYYGFASLILAFGTKVEFCYPAGSGHCVVAIDDDHGPYISGRTFDLNQTVADALGFSGVGTVSWRIL